MKHRAKPRPLICELHATIMIPGRPWEPSRGNRRVMVCPVCEYVARIKIKLAIEAYRKELGKI